MTDKPARFVEGLGYWCEFCQTYHSSRSCFHPGQARCAELEAEVEHLRGALSEMHDYVQNVAAIVTSPYPHTEVTLARWVLERCNAALGEDAGA